MNLEWMLSGEFLQSHPSDATRVLQAVGSENVAAYLAEVDSKVAATVLENMETVGAAECLAKWTDERIVNSLELLPLTKAARILRVMSNPDRDRVMKLVPEAKARVLREVLNFPEGTAAARMDPDVPVFFEDSKAAWTWKRLSRYDRRLGPYIYLVEGEGKLVGVMSLRELMTAPPNAELRSVMTRPVARIEAQDRDRVVVKHPGWQRYSALPVVDAAGVLIGVIRYATFRGMETGDAMRKPETCNSAVALAELYWRSTSTFLIGLLSTMGPRSAQPTKEEV
jgi:magnesium transporter